MAAEQALRLAAYVVVAVGITSLGVADLIGTVEMALAGVVLVAGGWVRDRIARASTLDPVLTAAVAAFAVVDVLYLAARVFDALVRFLVLLVLLRLLTARNSRECRDAGLLAFFMPVASAAVSLGVWFSFVFVGFLVAGTMLLVLGHELAEAERSGGPAAARALPAGRGMLTLGLAAAGGSLLVTLALFFVIPRIGEATLALTAPSRRMIVGFSDRVELGAIGELETDSSVAMRIRVGDVSLTPHLINELRWRGVVLDYFDGHAWTIARRRRAPLGRAALSEAEGRGVPGAGLLLTQEVFLEPIGTDTLFAAPRVLRARVPVGTALVDDMGALSMSHAASRLEYTVESIVGGRALERLSPTAHTRFLQLPPVAPRIATLAQEVTASSVGPAAAAQALTEYLRRDFKYTLSLERTTTLPPLEEFLFARRAGNCEYFASALAVMLRSLGIPARVVTGFQRGEWNPYGEYFLVRMSDAHAWVEAYIAGSGWLTLDPSPRDESVTAAWAGASLFLDALRLRWHRYIENWSSHDQLAAAATVRQAAGAWRNWREHWPRWPQLWPWAALAAMAVVLTWSLRRRGWSPRSRDRRAPHFYRRALRTLSRHGLRPHLGETAREFAGRVGDATPAHAPGFARITAAYEAVRFGARRLPSAELAEIEGCVRALAR
ncbi:MAG TPA: transglutaminaseTgpA domain-containing protein [Methylomirabilota bacterium]